MAQLYRAYMNHEAQLRSQLRAHRATGHALRQWRRAFFLDPRLRPTRDSVIDLEPVRGNFADQWFAPKAPHDPLEALRANREYVNRFLASIQDRFAPDEGHTRRTPMQIHSVARDVSLRLAYEAMLTRLWLARSGDSTLLTGLLLQVGRYLDDHADATCVIYRMSQGMTRDRDVDDDGEIPTLFQGPNYDESVDPRVTLYPGDREIRADGQVTIQIHTLRVKDSGNVLADDVPTIAVWIPRSMGAAWISQPHTRSLPRT
jgi:hypothetical protein